MLCFLRGIYALDLLEGSDVIGVWFENWVMGSIKTILTSQFSNPKFYFWKTTGNVEVDLVLEFENHVIPIEIKYSQKPDTKKTKHLKRFLVEEPRAQFGMMIYNGPYQYHERDRILYFPAWALM